MLLRIWFIRPKELKPLLLSLDCSLFTVLKHFLFLSSNEPEATQSKLIDLFHYDIKRKKPKRSKRANQTLCNRPSTIDAFMGKVYFDMTFNILILRR